MSVLVSSKSTRVQQYVLYMHGFGFISAKKVPESFLIVIPNGLVRHPDPHPLQVHTEMVRFK